MVSALSSWISIQNQQQSATTKAESGMSAIDMPSSSEDEGMIALAPTAGGRPKKKKTPSALFADSDDDSLAHAPAPTAGVRSKKKKKKQPQPESDDDDDSTAPAVDPAPTAGAPPKKKKAKKTPSPPLPQTDKDDEPSPTADAPPKKMPKSTRHVFPCLQMGKAPGKVRYPFLEVSDIKDITMF
jgi:hypothetical protein